MGLRGYLEARRARKLIPKEKRDFWYCYEFYNYQYELSRAGKPWKSSELKFPCETLLLEPYRSKREIKTGAILACIKLDGWIGYYEITKVWMYSSPGSDFAGWDDGKYVNLKFHHCERVAVVI